VRHVVVYSSPVHLVHGLEEGSRDWEIRGGRRSEILGPAGQDVPSHRLRKIVLLLDVSYVKCELIKFETVVLWLEDEVSVPVKLLICFLAQSDVTIDLRVSLVSVL
jgi:hypothetical protein